MAGGSWTTQNKVRPGAYINFKSVGDATVTVADRGVVTMPLVLPWGPEKQIIEINAGDSLFDMLGIDITEGSALLIKEAFKRARTLLLYRVNSGAKATVTLGALTITAKYGGAKGNDIKVVIEVNIDDNAKFDVITLVGTREVDKQIAVSNIDGLVNNSFVEFSGTGALTATAGVSLENGSDTAPTNADYSTYLSKAELYNWNTLGVPTKDATLKSIIVNFIKRLREQEGRMVQAVLENYAEADYEGIISVKNGVILSDLTEITSDKAVAFVAGATAGANVNQSNTYSRYDDAIDVDTRYTNSEIEAALKNGEMVFTINNGKVVIEQDINTLKTFTNDKQNYFRKNRVIRTLDGLDNDINNIWITKYIGNEDNNTDGRNLFKKDVIELLETYQGINAVENVVPEDVVINEGNDKDSVVAIVGAQPIDSMEKLYMTIEVR